MSPLLTEGSSPAKVENLPLPESICVFERGWLSSNNILFIGPTDTALVDSGYASHATQTVALVRQVLGTRPLDRLITTHLHSDHCGGNAALQRAYRCQTMIPAADAELVANWREDELSFAQTGQRCERFSFQATLSAGDELELGGLIWQAMAAPGHDPHALMLFCASEGILISGDALWERGFGVVFPELEGRPGFADTRRTLETIGELPLRVVIPGHGVPFTGIERSLEEAFARLDYLMADPVRNARHAIKVLLKFLLLEHQWLPLAGLAERFSQIILIERINERFLRQTPEQLCEAAIAGLIAAQAAALDGANLVNCEPALKPRPEGSHPRGTSFA
jgi:glyoxylase-like metal-dependent hydrolase (beta-lactamase superfamily II)